MRILAIDPGVNYFAYAVIEDGSLYTFGKYKTGAGRLTDSIQLIVDELNQSFTYDVNVSYIEHQYINPRANIDTKHIVDLATVAGAIAGTLSANESYIHLVKPAQWKGGIPKKKHQAQLLETLPAQWLERLGGERDSDILDAVGIARWATRKDYHFI